MSNSDEKAEQVSDDSNPESKDEIVIDESQIEEQTIPEPEKPELPKTEEMGGKKGIKKYFDWGYLKSHKKVSIPIALVLVLLIIVAVPFTRYPVLGLAVKKNAIVIVQDATTKAPISDAVVTINGKESKTNGLGAAEIRSLPVGKHTVKISKKYYKDAETTIGIGLFNKFGFNSPQSFDASMTATGRQVAIQVVNKISDKGIQGATIKAGDVEAKSGAEGKTVIVVPAGTTKQKVSVAVNGFNKVETEIEVKENEVKQNTVKLTPSGKVYFLSKKSGKIDVVKTNLDGTERQVVLAGTGKEVDRGTVLLASRDWKYLALLSRRDSDLAKLYLIETATDKLTTIDEGNATFGLTGWADDKFTYTVERSNVGFEQPKRYALKAYNATSKSIKILSETTSNENYNGIYAINQEVIFIKYGSNVEGSINTIRIDGTQAKKLKSLSANSYLRSALYEPNEVYFANDGIEYLEYEVGGSLKTIKAEDFPQDVEYPTFLLSPSGKQNLWSEARDGKNTIFLGDQDAENQKEVAALSDYKQYGWYSDEYLLVSKNSSELFILGRDALKNGQQPIKITDYHKPAQTYRSYGGGYGGF